MWLLLGCCTQTRCYSCWFHPPDGSVSDRLLIWNSIPNLKWDQHHCLVLLSSEKKEEKQKKTKQKTFVAFGVADPYLHNASRTNKTSSSGIVREAQREASTDMFLFFLKKSHKNRWSRWSRWRDRQRGREVVVGGGGDGGSRLFSGSR